MLVSTLTHTCPWSSFCAAGTALHMQVRALVAALTTSILASEVTGAAIGHWTSSVPVPWSTLVASQQVKPCTSDPGPQLPS